MDLGIINFPDEVFKKYLVENFDKDGDNEISITEALTIKKIVCSQKEITSMAGIEYFSNLEELDCSRNKIETIDLSANNKLRFLSCYDNLISSLNIENNTFLNTLYCGNCNLEYLDCSQNKELEILSCKFNPIKQIDLKNNDKLTLLRVRRCQLKELDLYSLKVLNFLDCSENELSELYLEENRELEYLDCACNDLYNDLYLGANAKLKYLDSRKNNCLFSITLSEGQSIERVLSDVKPMTESYRKYLLWREYKSENDIDTFCDNEENWEDQNLDALEGDESNYWNID